MYHILSCDGGGIRGIITATVLRRLETAHPGFLAQVDLFAGTSTGGLIALALAAGLTAAEVEALYTNRGPDVFADSFWDNLLDLGNLIGAQYGTANLENVLLSTLGDRRLRELQSKVLIATFDLDSGSPGPGGVRAWKAKFFHNYPGPDSDGQERVVDVAIRTASAPSYFPIYQGYVDGGVVAGNPSMCALAQALHPETGGQSLPQLTLLSLGTGLNPKYLESQDGDWGVVQWATRLVDMMLEGSVGLADYQCRQILQERYFRLNPSLPYEIPLDGVDQVPLMQQLAQNLDLEPLLDWMELFYE